MLLSGVFIGFYFMLASKLGILMQMKFFSLLCLRLYAVMSYDNVVWRVR